MGRSAKPLKVLPIDELDKFQKMAAALRNAQDFLCTYQVLQKYNRACVETGEPRVFSADIVNLMFAIELFLKTLLYGEGKKVEGHEINKLFECLSLKKQGEIKSAFNDHLLRTRGYWRDPLGISFEDRIEQYANSYNYWRYFHEIGRGTFNSQFCEILVYVLNQTAQVLEIKLQVEARTTSHI